MKLSTEAWQGAGSAGRRFHTPHYTINTTVQSEEFNQRLAAVMEGAWRQYVQMSGITPPTNARAMDCYMFATRDQWARFTRKYAGDDAAIYLKINRGGYTLADWFVAYYLGDYQTFSVAAHEGWHQFVARNFRGRIPPFLEEGIACMFESVEFERDGAPRWNWAANPHRASKLRQAIERDGLWPLDQLVQMHAGQIVDERAERIEAFYSQNWAFARFLIEGQHGRYRSGLKRLLADAATGQNHAGWDPTSVPPLLEHYLGAPLKQIEAEYLQFVREIAYASPSPATSLDENTVGSLTQRVYNSSYAQ